MAAASDLATLADVKSWLAGSSGIGSSDDALLSRLITDVSGAIAAYLGRPSLAPHAFTERLDGDGKTRLFCQVHPTNIASAITATAAAVTAAKAVQAAARAGN